VFKRGSPSAPACELCEGFGQTETTLLTGNFYGYDAVAGSMGMGSPFYNIELRNKHENPYSVARSARWCSAA
jgi:acyl-coenzyme A synthetase/AMP-(fatty) acid ligase